MSKRIDRLRAGLFAAALLVESSCMGHHTAAPLERIEQVAALPLQVADHRAPVRLKGWVTLSDPTTNLMFLEDGTGAARVALPFLHLDPRPGNLVEAIGEVTEGGPAPAVVASEVRLLEGRREPHALPIRVADLVAGRTGFRYVAVEGVVRAYHQDRSGNIVIRVGSGATVFEAYIGPVDLPNFNGIVAARVRIRAVANLSRDIYGRVARVQVLIPRSTDFEVLAPAPHSVPLQSIREVARLPRDSLAERIVHLHGAIHSDGVRQGLRLEDSSGSIRVRQSSSAVLPIGPAVDISGFAELEAGEVKITDARLTQPNPVSHPVDKGRVITSVAEIHALSPEEAGQRIPVHVRATVTYFDPSSANFFVQDQTGATYVGAPRIREFRVGAGDLVDLTGLTAPGQFAPIVSSAWAERVSSSAMPPPARAAFDDLLSGTMDSAWVQTEGIVQKVETRRASLVDEVSVQWGEHLYHVYVRNPHARPLPPPDSRIQVEGVCGSLFNARRQIVGIQIYVPSPEFLHVLETGPNPARLRPHPIDELLRFSFADSPGHRTRIRGVVTLASPSGPSYVEDSGAGVKIVNHARADLSPGDVVDILGFAHSGSFSPEMRDAQVSLLERGPAPSPTSITVDEALEGAYDSRLVAIDAAVVDQLKGANQNTVMLQVGGELFNATLDHGRIAPLDRGSIVHVTGVCSIVAEANLAYRIPRAFTLILRGAGDITLVRSAPWWSPGRLLAVLGSMAAVLLAVLSWVAVLRRKVRLQTAVIGKKLQQEELLKHAAEQASRAKSEFLANMSHEIRTPLNGILGFAGLMADSGLNGLQREHNEAVRSSAENLLVVINDILDFSRVEAGRLELESLDFPVRKCVAAALGSIRSLAAEKGLATSIQIDDDVPEWVRGDTHRLRQVLLNLLGNAVKFTAAGGIAVHVSLVPERDGAGAGGSGDPPSRQIRFAVSDTGIGVPAPQRELIFQPFRQADGSVTRRFGGTGLGLAISRKLVTLMGGTLGLESTEGQGSTFFFTASLPPGQAQLGGEELAIADSGPQPADQPQHRPLSILVAEDNTVNQRLIRILIEKRGHRATVVGNGAAALAAWAHDRFDCILMDVQMPEMDGYEATRCIRARELENGAHVPIVALTAHAMKGDREKCIEAGMDSYLSKPIQTAALDAALARLPPGGELSAERQPTADLLTGLVT